MTTIEVKIAVHRNSSQKEKEQWAAGIADELWRWCSTETHRQFKTLFEILAYQTRRFILAAKEGLLFSSEACNPLRDAGILKIPRQLLEPLLKEIQRLMDQATGIKAQNILFSAIQEKARKLNISPLSTMSTIAIS